MIHEAVHAWQESVARIFVVAPGVAGDPSSLTWDALYTNGKERQGVDYALDANNKGRIHLSQKFRKDLERYKNTHKGGPDFPYPLPPNVP